MEVQLKLWKSNQCATLPTCNSLLQVPFCFGCLKVQEQRFPKYWFSFTCLMPWFRSSFLFIFGRALLFHYCTHEGRSQHSVADMRVHCSILVSTCPWKICPYNANPQRPFFLQTYLFLLRAVRTASESTGKRVQSTEISVQFGPVRTKRTFFQKTHLFFHVRPSIRQNCFSSWHHKIRASGCAQTPCMFRISVAMCKCLPPQLIIKSRQRFYISTRIVDPKLGGNPVLVLRVGLNDVWGCLIQHHTGQAQNAHMI